MAGLRQRFLCAGLRGHSGHWAEEEAVLHHNLQCNKPSVSIQHGRLVPVADGDTCLPVQGAVLKRPCLPAPSPDASASASRQSMGLRQAHQRCHMAATAPLQPYLSAWLRIPARVQAPASGWGLRIPAWVQAPASGWGLRIPAWLKVSASLWPEAPCRQHCSR